MLKKIILIIAIFFGLSNLSQAGDHCSITLNYAPVFSSGFKSFSKALFPNSPEPAIKDQIGMTLEINGNILSLQYFNIDGFNVNAIAIGTSLFNKKFDNAIIDRFVFYGAFGFVNTSFASNNKTMLYVDTNYPDALVGILAYKSFVTAGFSYSYFSGLRINIGGNF